MSNVTKAKLIRIGNSRGVRIPKVVLDQLHLADEVELAVEEDRLVIRAAGRPRDGWEERYRLMRERADDRPADEFPTPAWDEEEWEW